MTTQDAPRAAGPGRKLRADAERNRRRILDGAAEIFAARGLAVTMDEIAAHAGVGVGTVYRRFPEKADLIDALFEDRISALASLAEEGLEADDPWEGLVGYIERSCELHARDRALRQLIFTSGHANRFVERGIARVRPVVIRLIARAKAGGALREDFEIFDVPLIQMAIVGPNDYIGDAAPDAWRRLVVFLLDGMRASRDRPTPQSVSALEDSQLRRATQDG